MAESMMLGGARFREGRGESAPERPLVSIITATYNAAAHLPKLIQSIREQTYDDFEWIVVDGASRDGTLDLLRQSEDVVDCWMSDPDKGIYDAWNRGLRLARGEWICFLGADDFLWDGSVLERAAEALSDTPAGIRVVYGQVMLSGTKGNQVHAIGEKWSSSLKRRFRQTMCIPHPATFHRASLFRERGEFDASYRIAADYEFLLRELRTGDALFIPGLITAGMRVNGVSSTPGNSLQILREVRRAQKQNGVGIGPLYVLALCRVWLRTFIWRVVGETAARRLLDQGRRVMGKPPYWEKT